MEDTTQFIRRCSRCGATLAEHDTAELCPACAADNERTVVSEAAGAAAFVPEPPWLEPGQAFGPYRILRLLGRGGMGEVYEAEHGEHGRRVALKVLNSQLQSAGDRTRFLSEGRLAASISHPHAVYIYGSEEIGGRPVISMELLPGGTLKDRVVAEGPLPAAEAVTAILDIIDGLDAASAAGILHRDIKPSNCFNDHDGTVKVGDFGLSISTRARQDGQQAVTGNFEGTPQFAAPEQLRGESLDVRADIYAVGATLFYLLTGRPPFDSRDLGELVRNVTTAPPPSPRQSQPAVPAGLAAVVQRCLAKKAADRPASYTALSDLLRPFSARQDLPAPLGVRLMAGLVDAVIVGLPASLLDSSEQVGYTVSSGSTGASFHVNPWAWVLGVLYFLVVEGLWGTSAGKRIFGLRVSSAGNPPSWSQAGIRTLLYNISGMTTAVPVFVWGMAAVEAWVVSRPLVALLAAFTPILVTAGLFLPARRRNGWAAIQDLASGTRVVWRVRESARAEGQADDAVMAPAGGAVTDVTRIGPFEITAVLGSTSDGRLLLGADPILHRRVWIHTVAPGTPPVSAARRDVRRPGRLHWLAGQRSGDDNWDAFEAPDGAPARADGHVPWATARITLVELANELAASVKEHTVPPLALNRVWTRRNGRAVLLDFAAPGVSANQDDGDRSPVQLLSDVARAQLGSLQSATPALPLPATMLLADWRAGRMGTLEDTRMRLTEAARLPEGVPRLRRALPILAASLPIVMLTVAAAVAMVAVRGFATPEKIEIVGLLTALPDRPPETRAAIETYLAGRHGSRLASDEFWSDIVMQGSFSELRAPARALLAAHPAVTDEDMQRVAALVQPEVERAARSYTETMAPRLAQSGSMIVSGLAAIFLILSVVNALFSAAIVRGGVVSRLMGLAAITRKGREIGRVRSLLRAIVAWSPAMAWLATLGTSPVDYVMAGHPSTMVGLALALGVMAAGVAWTISKPGRGPHDWICGTWVVMR